MSRISYAMCSSLICRTDEETGSQLMVSDDEEMVEASAMTAGMSTTATADAAKVGAWLQREDVQAQLMARGVSVQEAQARVAALGERDLARLGTTIDAMPAGSGALAIAGVVLVVMLILELLGVTDLFKSM